ncbi:MAG: N-acetyl sugar amidotransferase [Planctomycetaceae bacterium]|jgi:N-acetyl sugar amidotransferase|nr:N-acetyl sugar amidotransferase [Planctomycetaceae bacterium]
MIKYCTLCLYPETKPDLWFDESGVCSACLAFGKRAEVDWAAREQEFLELVQKYRNPEGGNYDCVVPVSGGKDSTCQVIRMRQAGMNPLCVVASTDSLSSLGRRNIENLKGLGVDMVEYTLNPVIRRRMNKLCLEQVGDVSWPEHAAIFTVPIRVAVQFGVQLVVWGENSQNEYGGPAANQESKVLDRRWLEEFGGLLGLRVSDLVGEADIEQRHMIPYTYPSDAELARVGVTGVFLGYYFPWDGLSNVMLAQAYGFEVSPTLVEGSLANYENLDNHQTGIHDYFKYLKYGFGRATDIANNQIRRGRLLRKDALEMVRRHDGQYPASCLGKSLEIILGEIDMSKEAFDLICDRFTNKQLFQTDTSGQLLRDKDYRLIKQNDDNPK